MARLAQAHTGQTVGAIQAALVAEAQAMLKEDDAINRRMGQAGQVLIHNGQRVLTHCNTGALATGAYGTALGVLRAAWEAGKKFSVWVDETRPLLQGARLTTWELGKLGIPYTLIPDGAAATLMRQGRVDLVILGADRIAANGDTANKIGTYSLAVLAHHHGIPFYVAAPLSTVDFAISDGSHIPVEERAGEEVTHLWGQRIAPAKAQALNLAFDVTPNELIAGIINEKGVMTPPFTSSLKPFRPHQE
jgi:methylthioribose-1-phosphate isomerase